MALYLFACDPCETTEELLVSMDEIVGYKPDHSCGRQMHRVFTTPGVKSPETSIKPYFHTGMGVQVNNMDDERRVDEMHRKRGLIRGHWAKEEGKRSDPAQKRDDKISALGSLEGARQHAQQHRDKLKAQGKFRSAPPPPRRKPAKMG